MLSEPRMGLERQAAVALLGPRQAGKTTLARALALSIAHHFQSRHPPEFIFVVRHHSHSMYQSRGCDPKIVGADQGASAQKPQCTEAVTLSTKPA